MSFTLVLPVISAAVIHVELPGTLWCVPAYSHIVTSETPFAAPVSLGGYASRVQLFPDYIPGTSANGSMEADPIVPPSIY
ncbi:hypothetical protein B9Z19DRAFT_1132440 [Tuber borchii]|uniref:Uncharacterized protein n=1 Tax=Tuber borchii TaxID=42251 RepID=A0A2T6ZH86_TUBBO|nr:hypothetical protein B9Z19DRAFT_1132440 [Tuber borchii]